ncbi:hypothetical protein [uncultured Sphingomonas sp.]|uniref:hypothetical protein n=1 Tax=uncultured Sphingomonas sp. TaxID=158754 RepID=UPI0035CA1D7D
MAEAKIGIGSVWDSAVDAVRGRARLLAPLAAVSLFLPGLIQAGLMLYVGGAAGDAPPRPYAAGALLRFALTLGLLALTFWGALAITAVTGDPAVGAAEARRRASARLLPLLGASVVLGLVLTLLILPVLVILIRSGVEMAAMGSGTMPTLGAGASLFVGLYGLFATSLLLWLLARLLPLVPVVLNERLGLRAIGRSFRLTRGLGFKLVGVLLLYFVVLYVATNAAQWVTFIPFRLMLGADNTGVARFIGAVVGAVVATAFSLLAYAFTAQLHERLVARDRLRTVRDAPPPA